MDIFFFFFFFQAEDGIRDLYVTGVQTCALPIYLVPELASAPFGCRSGYLSAPMARKDRKSTRNSSHVEISYAVFCLKKKTEVGFKPSQLGPLCQSYFFACAQVARRGWHSAFSWFCCAASAIFPRQMDFDRDF